MSFKYVFAIVLTISLLLSYNSIKAVISLKGKRERLYSSEELLRDLKEENKKLREKLEYRKSDEFIIKEAREKLNYTYEGEQIVIVPSEYYEEEKEDSGKIETVPDEKVRKDKNTSEQSSKSPYEMWIDTFF